MKRLSIKLRVTLWFMLLMLLLAAVTLGLVLRLGENVLDSAAKQNLTEICSFNAAQLRFTNGVLEIDPAFVRTGNRASFALYAEDSALLAGALPPAFDAKIPFRSGEIRAAGGFYFYDLRVAQLGRPVLWLRGAVASTQVISRDGGMLKAALIVLPLLAALAAAGGYFITHRAFRPVEQLRRAGQEISSGEDLSRRIAIGGGDELHRLAVTFNAMLTRLEASFEQERQFTADASHELRTPVAVILAQCESLELQDLPEETACEIAVIRRQAQKMHRLIQSLLALARLESGTEEIAKTPVDFSALLAEQCGEFVLLHKNIITDIAPKIIVTGNRELLGRMATNLIANAVQYSNPAGRIWVSLQKEAGRAVLRVRDEGIGIAPEQQENIWRRLYQADAARQAQGGMGLGLCMVRQIARAHGGQAYCESEPGKGSMFCAEVQLLTPSGP
jgi:signal transduction histidine kinase